MSHIVFITRGHWDWVRMSMEELATRYFLHPKYNKRRKKMEKELLKSRLCPIQLWDLSYPKEYTDSVLNTLFRETGKKGMVKSSHLSKIIWPVRKIMKLKKIPEYKTDRRMAMNPMDHIEIIGVGYREDKWVTEDGRIVEEKDRTPFSTEEI